MLPPSGLVDMKHASAATYRRASHPSVWVPGPAFHSRPSADTSTRTCRESPLSWCLTTAQQEGINAACGICNEEINAW